MLLPDLSGLVLTLYSLNHSEQFRFQVTTSLALFSGSDRIHNLTLETHLAAVYLKNKVIKNWELKEYTSSAISEEEKPAFRDRLIPAIISAPPQTQQHLIQILNRVITYDYPAKWPTFLEHMMQLLHSQNVQHIHTGLICLSEVTDAYRWRNHEARQQLEPVLDGAFSRAVQIGTNIINENSAIAGDMIRLIMKSYRSAIYVSFYSLAESL